MRYIFIHPNKMNYSIWRDVVLNKMEFIAFLFQNKRKATSHFFSNTNKLF